MKRETWRTLLERLSFFLWMVFTIFSISLAGVGVEGALLACYLILISSAQPVHFPLSMILSGGIGIFLSIFWRQVGIDHFHYLAYDAGPSSEAEREAPSRVLKELIGEVEKSAGYARNDARAKAKAWLMKHGSSLEEEDVLLAKTHFGYMLPAGWGDSSPEPPAPLG